MLISDLELIDHRYHVKGSADAYTGPVEERYESNGARSFTAELRNGILSGEMASLDHEEDPVQTGFALPLHRHGSALPAGVIRASLHVWAEGKFGDLHLEIIKGQNDGISVNPDTLANWFDQGWERVEDPGVEFAPKLTVNYRSGEFEEVFWSDELPLE